MCMVSAIAQLLAIIFVAVVLVLSASMQWPKTMGVIMIVFIIGTLVAVGSGVQNIQLW